MKTSKNYKTWNSFCASQILREIKIAWQLQGHENCKFVKFRNSVFHILREIEFGNCRVMKIANLSNLGILFFTFYVKSNLETLESCTIANLTNLEILLVRFYVKSNLATLESCTVILIDCFTSLLSILLTNS